MCRRLTINFCRLQNYIHLLNEKCPLISSMSIIIMTLRIVVPLAEIEGQISAQYKAHTHARTHARTQALARYWNWNTETHILAYGWFLRPHHVAVHECMDLRIPRVRAKQNANCYRWSWFEARSKVCSAERQAKVRDKNKVKFGTYSKRISLCAVHWYVAKLWASRLLVLSLWTCLLRGGMRRAF
jgi:hypothetical protein